MPDIGIKVFINVEERDLCFYGSGDRGGRRTAFIAMGESGFAVFAIGHD